MSFLKRFSGLQWKLAFSYVAVTLLTVLALEVVVVLAMDWFGVQALNAWLRRSALDQAEELAGLVVEPLEMGSHERLAQALDQSSGLKLIFEVTTDDSRGEGRVEGARVIVGPQGNVLASDQPEQYPTGTRFAEPGMPEAERLVARALADVPAASRVVEGPNLLFVATPVAGAQGTRLGLVYYRLPLLDPDTWAAGRLGKPLLATTLSLLPCMVPLGLVFGFVTAIGFTRRLRRLAEASSGLAAGDLGRRVRDPSGDEIGQLARQFNGMAEQLERDTVQLRELAEHNARLARQSQRLAALEERHRLARDLHDGVKQHLFGVNLAVATTLNLLDADPAAARAKLLEAGALSREAQAEMQALLNELRPAGLDERGLVAALTDYLAAFERREGIEVRWQAEGDCALPLTHAQALFRVAQEALANVARHAHAARVTV